MFERTRLKLTAWYLLIIMLISFLFSFVIYKGAERELERISRRQFVWRERMRDVFERPDRPEFFDPIAIEEIRQRIILMLIFVNSGILVISGLAGYFLAGRTLQPIKEMVSEQNRFIADASHELRTPLTALKTATEVGLRDKKITLKKLKELLTENLSGIDDLQSLSDSLLKLAQFEKPNTKVAFSSVFLSDVFQEAQKKVASLAQAKNIKIKVNPTKYRVSGEKEILVDLIKIILDNAIKYSPEGEEIAIFTRKEDSAITIEIKDQGIGIASRDLPHIFDRFYRADTSRSKTLGYGLGLSIAKKIVEKHQGSIRAVSKVGQGTTISIQLPQEHV